MKNAIPAGDVTRTAWPSDWAGHINLYQGSGRCGACFDAWGLMNNGARGEPLTSQAKTVLTHADYWHRGKFGIDYWLPMARLIWADALPPPPTEYHQALTLYDGRLRTEYAAPGFRYALTSWFDPDHRDVLAMELDYEGRLPDLLLAPETRLQVHYQQSLAGEWSTVTLWPEGCFWIGSVRVGTADGVVGLRVLPFDGEVALLPETEGLRLRFSGERGRHFIVIGLSGAKRTADVVLELKRACAPEGSAHEAREAWQRRYGDAFVHLPVPEHQALWARSLYYVLCSYAPDVRSMAAPMGWSGSAWPFNFPQDLSYIHPTLLRLGHLDIARAWVEHFRNTLGEMRAITRRIYRADGVMWAWEYPIGPGSPMLLDGAPNTCQYEIHNAAYPARMARETALHLRDPQWARDVAWPVIHESARFFDSVCRREEDGTWGIFVEPSMGQDEMGGPNQRNYLCALYSAEYCFRAALAMSAELRLAGLDRETERWRAVLRDGLAYRRLLDPALGFCVTCEGHSGSRQIGRQKHPVQINPLVFLPLGGVPDHARCAYERRDELCEGAPRNHFHGWTLAAYWLAASHMADPAGLARELGRAVPARYVDPAWLQIYETSGSFKAPYYTTSHGLYLQAVNDAFVDDYFGPARLNACVLPAWRGARIANLRTAAGRLNP
jgi:hypothetical protein